MWTDLRAHRACGGTTGMVPDEAGDSILVMIIRAIDQRSDVVKFLRLLS